MVESSGMSTGSAPFKPPREKATTFVSTKEVEGKNVVTNYESSHSWSALGVPESIQKGVFEMGWMKPSRVQAQSIHNISKGEVTEDNKNMAFQAPNGSGKTGSFIVPTLMQVLNNK